MAGVFNSAIFNNAVFNVGDYIPPGTINYQGDGKTRKKRRNKTHELFNAIEASIRRTVLGEPLAIPVTAVQASAMPSVTPAQYQDAITQLIALAADHAYLSAKVDRLQHDLVAHAIRQHDDNAEEELLMLM